MLVSVNNYFYLMLIFVFKESNHDCKAFVLSASHAIYFFTQLYVTSLLCMSAIVHACSVLGDTLLRELGD